MTALITLSHGSRHPRAKEGIRALTEAAAAKLGVEWADAHLEFDTPTLADAARELARAGHREAVVVPLLFTRAFHAKVDVPEAVRLAREHMRVVLAEPLGAGEDIADALASRVPADASRVVLYPVGTSNEEQAKRYEALAGAVEKHTARPTVVVAATRGGTDALQELAPFHLLPLFVTHGTLLDSAYRALPKGCTASEPLTTALAGVVAHRYLQKEKAHVQA